MLRRASQRSRTDLAATAGPNSHSPEPMLVPASTSAGADQPHPDFPACRGAARVDRRSSTRRIAPRPGFGASSDATWGPPRTWALSLHVRT